MFKRILVSTDGTPHSNRAVKAAARLASGLDASLVIFHAVPRYQSMYYPDAMGLTWPPEKQYERDATAGAEQVLERAKSLSQKEGIEASTTSAFSDAPSEAIAAAATKTKADLIVMASHGRRGMAKLLLGSETQKVLTHSKIPVLVIR